MTTKPAAGEPDVFGCYAMTIVRARGLTHLVLGRALDGIRCDLVGDAPTEWQALRFQLLIDDDLPTQLAELERLHDLLQCRLCAPRALADPGKTILALRTIDALGDGASLRDIGTSIIGADAWPGEGEWAKSRARRLSAAAQAMWIGGPRRLLNARGAGG